MEPTNSNRILVCIDFQEQSMNALHQCYDLARFVKAEILLLYVIESSDLFSGFNPSNIEDARRDIEGKLKQIAEKEYASTDIPFSYAVEVGKVHECILRKAKEQKVNFIVMGKNGTNQGLRKFLGSNTIKVLSESPCPVITLKGRYSIGFKNIVLPLNLNKGTQEKVAHAISFSNFLDLISTLSLYTQEVLYYLQAGYSIG